jgi:hypothetical protein
MRQGWTFIIIISRLYYFLVHGTLYINKIAFVIFANGSGPI